MVEVESRRVTSVGSEHGTAKSANKNFDSIKLHDEVLSNTALLQYYIDNV